MGCVLFSGATGAYPRACDETALPLVARLRDGRRRNDIWMFLARHSDRLKRVEQNEAVALRAIKETVPILPCGLAAMGRHRFGDD